MYANGVGLSGPLFCAVEAAEEAFCRSLRGGEDRSCESSELCTSTCQCWDGEGMRDTDTALFEGVTIQDQGMYSGGPGLEIPLYTVNSF